MPAPIDPQKKEIWKQRLSISHKGAITWNKGLKMSDDFRSKVSKNSLAFWNNPANAQKIKLRNLKVSAGKMGDKNPMKRLELRRKQSEWMKGRFVGDKNPSKKPGVRLKISKALKGHGFSTETRNKISQTLNGKLVGEKNPFYGRHHTEEVREKSRLRAISQITSGSLRNRRTSIELKILEELKVRGLEFIEQHPLENITVVDFYLPKYNIVLYCDGSFWHKGKWAIRNNTLEKDLRQKLILESCGYKVFRFDEEKINQSAVECVNEVQEYILK